MQLSEIVIFVENLYLTYGLPVVFLTSLIEITPIGWAVPGGTFLTLGGFFAYGRPAYLIATILMGWLGSWSTFFIAYLLGAGAAAKLNINIKTNGAAEKAEKLLNKQGPVIMTSAMVASITRFWISFYAGSKKYDFKKFSLYSGVASFSWTSFMIVIGYLAGTQRQKLETTTATIGVATWTIFLLFIGFLYYKIRKDSKKLQ